MGKKKKKPTRQAQTKFLLEYYLQLSPLSIDSKMFSRTLLTSRNAIKAKSMSRSMGYVTDFKPATMAEYPVPAGCWKATNSARQRKNNLHLLGGIAFFTGTIVVAKESELVDFGWGPKIG